MITLLSIYLLASIPLQYALVKYQLSGHPTISGQGCIESQCTTLIQNQPITEQVCIWNLSAILLYKTSQSQNKFVYGISVL